MVLRFHDFYFMVFISREYLGVEVSFRYDEWHGDIGGIFMIPFVRILFGYELRQEESQEELQEAVEDGECY